MLGDARKVVAESKRGTRLPADWYPSPELIAWAKAEAPHVDGQRESEKFRNHWLAKAGQGATKLDWSATWRNWILNARDRYGGVSRASPSGGFDKEAALARARERDAREEAIR